MLADECQIMEELSVQQVVGIVTDVQVDSNDEQDEEEQLFAPTMTALEAQEHLQGVARYCSGIKGLSMLVNTLKDMEVQIDMHQIKTSMQLSILDIFQRVGNV